MMTACLLWIFSFPMQRIGICFCPCYYFSYFTLNFSYPKGFDWHPFGVNEFLLFAAKNLSEILNFTAHILPLRGLNVAAGCAAYTGVTSCLAHVEMVRKPVFDGVQVVIERFRDVCLSR